MGGERAKSRRTPKMFISVLITTVLTVYVWRAMMDRLQPAMAQEGGNFQCPFGGGTVAKTEANKCEDEKHGEVTYKMCKTNPKLGCQPDSNTVPTPEGTDSYCCPIICPDRKRTHLVDGLESYNKCHHSETKCTKDPDMECVELDKSFIQYTSKFCCPRDDAGEGSSEEEDNHHQFGGHSKNMGFSNLFNFLNGLEGVDRLFDSQFCTDHSYCGSWAKNGFCENPFYDVGTLAVFCPRACHVGCGLVVHQHQRSRDLWYRKQQQLFRKHY